ncbi:hypothetical protein NBO_6g0077 [Nosema bombycis CQ1]|uniref:Uncharacterized protein n=1 Tax=Nosema bombycis (strain CQ1 / CVCC 102059) TaxID=578461 RepID=R0KWR7_NOSB1|nr:hypothetical protein NBO_6g0077 [Nosema bombycis CQ1]|eukprot:EOB15326.1 hypothetical protein NBO_6g0077 [Nosema bombycis CQ1]
MSVTVKIRQLTPLFMIIKDVKFLCNLFLLIGLTFLCIYLYASMFIHPPFPYYPHTLYPHPFP